MQGSFPPPRLLLGPLVLGVMEGLGNHAKARIEVRPEGDALIAACTTPFLPGLADAEARHARADVHPKGLYRADMLTILLFGPGPPVAEEQAALDLPAGSDLADLAQERTCRIGQVLKVLKFGPMRPAG